MNTSKSNFPLKSVIAPQSVAAAASATSGWVDAGDAEKVTTVVNLGALGGGTVALTFEQARDADGGGAKALSAWTGGAVATTLTVDNQPELLDLEGGFSHVRAKLTVTGGSGALVSAALFGTGPRYLA